MKSLRASQGNVAILMLTLSPLLIQIIRQVVQMAMEILTAPQEAIHKALLNPIHTCRLIQIGQAPIRLARGLTAQDQEEMPMPEVKVYSERASYFQLDCLLPMNKEKQTFAISHGEWR